MKSSKFETSLAFTLLFALLFFTNAALAASHTISMSAEVLPNGQLAYKMGSHSSSDGATDSYPVEAVIPGPTLFVKVGDTVNVSLTNNTSVKVGFNVPGLSSDSSEASPGQSKTFTFTANKKGTYSYFDGGSQLLGLFGAIIVDQVDGTVQSLVEAEGQITAVKRPELAKEFVLYMVGSTFWGTEIRNGTQTPIWTNPTLGAVENDAVRFHILAVGPGHTFHLHAHRWPDQTDFADTGVEPHIIDAKLMPTGSATHSFTVRAGTGVGEGHWQYHCHLVSHMESGMAGKFHVVGADSGQVGSSIAGASPSGAIFGNTSNEPGLVTFEISDEPGSWFRSARADTIFSVTESTRSLEIIPPGSSVHFIMSDTNGVHTISSLLWPSDADDPVHGDHHTMPFTQTKAYRGGGIVRLDVPGLYVFTCKIHPYMFGAVIVDDPNTEGLDFGESIDLATGVNGLPTSSDLATRLVRTFFVATSQNNWMDYTSSAPWHVKYANVPVRITGGAVVNLRDVLEARYGQDTQLTKLFNPTIPGVGEVWINTQFEKTAGKTKPGTITVLDAANWTIKRKIALPSINMNNPHNIWSDKDQSIVYQTQWFDTKLTFINREDGALLHNIDVGDTPSHVMTLPATDDITVAINGANGIVRIPAGTTTPDLMMPTQGPGQTPANPHGHWITPDGKIITPNINTSDVGIYDSSNGSIIARPKAGGIFPEGPHPIAIGVGIDKIYATNLLDHSINVLSLDGTLLKTIALLADYDPFGPTGPDTLKDRDGDGLVTVGVLPIQTPVDPTGRVVVTANTGGTITIVDTSVDRVVAMLPCDPGCHGANFGAKSGGGYYAYVTSKFSNELIVVDPDPNGDGNFADAAIAGRISMVAGSGVPSDDTVSGLPGMGGQGIYAIPNIYNGWVQNLPDSWKASLTAAQLNPVQ
ncbi:MAG: multicopper oxidase domain-containing protein [Nitrosomonas sp.]|nr:MAG: multicopper oxidase domain-containing protein [Nitrosomonas sp.]